MKAWQNGWVRDGSRIAFGCAGCGKYIPAAYVVDVGMPPAPEYPFDEGDCPVCELQEKVFDMAHKLESPTDKLTERLLLFKKGEQ